MSPLTLPEGDWIRGITIRQPWATCILAGKNPENRPVNWPWQGWMLIHAGLTLEQPALRDPLGAYVRPRLFLLRTRFVRVLRLSDAA